MLISDISLSKKLSLTFGIMLLMLSGLLLFNNFTINVSQNNFKNLLNHDISLEKMVNDIDISLLRLKNIEKDFLFSNNFSYVKKHRVEWKNLQSNFELLHRLSFQNVHLGITEHIELLIKYANDYKINFANLIEIKERIGASNNLGLEGRFINAALALNSSLSEYDVESVYLQYLLLRRWEKDFVSTHNEKYKLGLSTILAKYKNILNNSTSEENTNQIQALAGYKQALEHYFSLKNPYKKLTAYENMIFFADKLEIAIKAVFIENNTTLTLQLHRSEKDYLRTADTRDVSKVNDAILALKKQVNTSTIDTKYRDKLLALLERYDVAFKDLIEKNILTDTHSKSLRNVAHKIEPLLRVIKSILKKSKQSSLSHSVHSIENFQSISLMIGLIILLVGLFITIMLNHSITKPINAMVKVVTNITKGDLSQPFIIDRGDEIGKLAISINLMVQTLNEISEQADLIAKGDFSIEILPQSKTDKLAISLNEMKKQITNRTRLMQESERALQVINNTLIQQNELKNQLSKMTEVDHKSDYLQAICDKTISALAKLTASGHGALYVVNENNDKFENCLTLVGSYGLKKKHAHQVISIGAGLVGQCAKEKNIIIITEVPDGYIYINSALGQQLPLNIMLTPVMFEQKLMAVIELASFSSFTQAHQAMLLQVTEYIGFIINQQKNKQLLRDLQAGS